MGNRAVQVRKKMQPRYKTGGRWTVAKGTKKVNILTKKVKTE